jgi:hypothetical protein
VAGVMVLYGSNVTTAATGLSGAAHTDAPTTLVTDGMPGVIVPAKVFVWDREVSLTAGKLAGQALATALVDAVSVPLVRLVFATGARFFGGNAASPLILGDSRSCKSTGRPTRTTECRNLTARETLLRNRSAGGTSWGAMCCRQETSTHLLSAAATVR